MCSHDGCERKAHARGWCRKHYAHWYNHQRRATPKATHCERCGDPIPPDRQILPNVRYCTKVCQKRGEKERAKARGYRVPGVPLTCSHCGVDYTGTKPKADAEHLRTYCSPSCQAEAMSWRYRKVFSCKVPWRECDRCSRSFLGRGGATRCHRCKEEEEPGQRRWTAGYCIQCGDAFVGRWHSLWPCRYCSDRCIKKAAKTRRRARKRNAWVEEVWRPKVYERDNWTCRICHEPVDRDAEVPDPLAPTLDHIVPLALGGDHSYANVQCAHYRCNSLKGAACEGQLHFAA